MTLGLNKLNGPVQAHLRDFVRGTVVWVSCFAVATLQIAPAYAQVTLVDTTKAAEIKAADASDGVRQLTTNDLVAIAGGGTVGVNEFSTFNLAAADKLRLVQPGAASALVNFIDGSNGVSSINGQLTLSHETAGSIANTYLVNPSGFIVGGGAEIFAHHLTMSTAMGGKSNLQAVLDNTAALGDGDITFEAGSQINAWSLNVWTAGNLLAAGTISVSGEDASGAAPTAINMSQRQSATHASVRGGVVRFGAGSASVTGSVSARKTTAAAPSEWDGGEIWIETHGQTLAMGVLDTSAEHTGALVIGENAELTASSSVGAGNGGQITLKNVRSHLFSGFDAANEFAVSVKTRGSAKLDASGAVNGGLIAATGQLLSLGGEMKAGGGMGTNGNVVAMPIDKFASIRINEGLSTDGGNLTLSATRIAITSNIDTSTTAGISGDISAFALDTVTETAVVGSSLGQDDVITPEISVTGGADLIARSATNDSAGRVTLIAKSDVVVNGLFLASNEKASATITIDNAEILAGAVLITADASATSRIEGAEASVAQSIQEALSTEISASLESVSTALTSGLDRAADIFAAKLPVQIEDIAATAIVSITNSTVDSDGTWLDTTTSSPADPTEMADNGYLLKDGLARRDITFFHQPETTVLGLSTNPAITLGTQVAQAYKRETDAIFIHSHAETEAFIHPGGGPFNLAYVETSTTANTIVKNTTVRTDTSVPSISTGNTVISSTASEMSNIKLQVSGIKGSPGLGLIFTNGALNNQTIIDTGPSHEIATQDFSAAAYTGKNHRLENFVGANQGELVIAFSYSDNTSLTQAALGGTISTDQLNLKAETLTFADRRDTQSTLGSSTTPSNAYNSVTGSAVGAAATAYTIKGLLKPDAAGTGAKDRIAAGFAIDVNTAKNDTFAILGGSYVNSGSAQPFTSPTNVTTRGTINVDATRRMARLVEGGDSQTLVIKAKMSSLSELIEHMKVRHGADGAGFDDKDFGFFSAIGIRQLQGATTAKIGLGTNIITPGIVRVTAETAYQTTDEIFDFQGRANAAIDKQNSGSVNFATGAVTKPTLPALWDIFDPNVFLSSSLGTQSVQSAAAGGDQDVAIGLNVLLFETKDTTNAIVEDGVSITNSVLLDVNARSRGVFVHKGADGAGPTFSSAASAGALIGVGVSVPRLITKTNAIVGDVILANVGDVDIDAETDFFQLAVVKGGGFAKAEVAAINAGFIVGDYEAETIASFGDGAQFSNLDALTIDAVDRSHIFSSALGLNATVGAVAATGMIAVNDISRKTQAVYGSGTGGSGLINTARLIDLKASNTGADFAIAVAGSANATAGEPVLPSGGGSHAVPIALVRNGMVQLLSQNNYATTGSLALNIHRQDIAETAIDTSAKVTLTEDAKLLSESTTLAVAAAGAISFGLGVVQSANIVAGAVAYQEADRQIIARIAGVELTARDLNAQARDLGKTVNVAITGSGALNASIPLVSSNAAAGSLSRVAESGLTSVQIQNADITLTGNLVIGANSLRTLVSSAGAGAAAPLGASVGLSTGQILSSHATGITLSASQIDAQGTATLIALSERDAIAIGLSVGFGKFGFGATAALSEFTGSTLITANTVDLTATGISVETRNSDDQNVYAGSLGFAYTANIGAASATTLRSGGVKVTLNSSKIASRGDIAMKTLSRNSSIARAVGLSVAGNLAAGLSISVIKSSQVVELAATSSDIFARDNILLKSDLDDSANTTAITVAGSATAAIAGSSSYSEVNNQVRVYLNDSNALAGGTLAALSRAKVTSTMMGGGDSLLNGTGTFAAGGAAGIGVNVNVVVMRNTVDTKVIGVSDLRGYGHSTMNLGARLGTTARGVVLDATSESAITNATAGVFLGGKAAAIGAVSVNKLNDRASVILGDGDVLQINGAASQVIADANLLEPADTQRLTRFLNIYDPIALAITTHADQDLIVRADVTHDLDVWSINVAGSGGVAVGVASATNLFSGGAMIQMNALTASAKRNALVQATHSLDLTQTIAGLAAGQGAAAASVGYSENSGSADVLLRGTDISTGNSLTIAAQTNNVGLNVSGQLAGGLGVGAGAAIVNVDKTRALVSLGDMSVTRKLLSGTPAAPIVTYPTVTLATTLVAGGHLSASADVKTDLSSFVVSGGIGGGGVALSTVVDLITATSQVDVGAGQSLQGNSVTLSAGEDTDVSALAGTGFAGGGAVGGALHYMSQRGGSAVQIGAGATIQATYALALNALTDRTISSQVGVATITVASISSAISMINLQAQVIDPRGGSGADRERTDFILGEQRLSDSAGSDDDAFAETMRDALDDTGATAEASDAQTAQNSASVGNDFAGLAPAAAVVGTGVSIGQSAQLYAGSTLNISAEAIHDIDQDVGLLAAGGGSVSASIGLADLGTQATINIGRDAIVSTNTGSMALSARTGSRAAGTPAIDSNVRAISVATGGSLGAGVSVVTLSSNARINILQGAQLSTNSSSAQVALSATRNDEAHSQVSKASIAVLGAIGFTIAKSNNTGLAEITIGEVDADRSANIIAGNITVDVRDDTLALADAKTIEASLGLAGAGADADAVSRGTTRLILKMVQMLTPGDIVLNNVSTSRADATAHGLGVAGAIAAVVSLADSTNDAVIETRLTGTALLGGSVLILSELNASKGTNSSASSDSKSYAGVAAGSGTFSNAALGYSVTTVISDRQTPAPVTTNIQGTDFVSIRSRSEDAASTATASGRTGAALAIGVVEAYVGQLNGRFATVEMKVQSGFIKSNGTVTLQSVNTQTQTVRVDSGAGGIVAGDFTQAQSTLNATTLTEIGNGGVASRGVTLEAGDLDNPDDTRLFARVNANAWQNATVSSTVDNTSASLVGLSKAKGQGNYASNVDLKIGIGVTGTANAWSLSTMNGLDRPSTVLSEAGGGITGAAVSSIASAIYNTNIVLDGGVSLTQVGDPDLADPFSISNIGLFDLRDLTDIDVAAVLALPFGISSVGLIHDNSITIGDARLLARGDLVVSTGSNAKVSANQNTVSSGLASPATATAFATLSSDALITVTGDATLESYSDILLGSGYLGEGRQFISTLADARVFNKTAIPITTDPTAVATASTTSKLDIGSGAIVDAYQNVALLASNGERTISGFGLAKDFYREIIAGAASLVGAELVLDTETGETIDNKSAEIVVNANVRSGAYHRRVLNFRADDVLDNTSFLLPDGSGFESQAYAPDASFYEVDTDFDEIQALVDRRDAVQALLTPATPPVTPLTAEATSQYTATIASYNNRITELGGESAAADAEGRHLTRIKVNYLRASEGSVRVEADTFSGTGSLFAADEADIRINVASGGTVQLDGLEITDVEGGRVTFNERLLGAGLSEFGVSVAYAENVTEASDWTGTDNAIVVINSSSSGSLVSLGDIELAGAATALTGTVDLLTTEGSIYAGSGFEALVLSVKAPKGSIESVTPDPGVRHIGPSPAARYNEAGYIVPYLKYLEGREQFGVQSYYGSLSGGVNDSHYTTTSSLATLPTPSINAVNFEAGKSVNLVAQYVNISGVIRAGVGRYMVDLPTGLQGVVNSLESSNRSGRTRIAYKASGANELKQDVYYTTAMPVSTNVDVYFNHDTGKLELAPIILRGGAVYITANVISTGGGVIEAVDGLGSLNINSDLTHDLVLNAVDLGDGLSQAGLVRIVDHAKKFTNPDDGKEYFETTDYVSAQGTLNIYSNRNADNTVAYFDDPNTGVIDQIKPNRLISTSSVSEKTYATKAGRDFIMVTQQTQLVRMARYTGRLVHGDWALRENYGATEILRIPFAPGSHTQLYHEYFVGVIPGTTQTRFSFKEPITNGYLPVDTQLNNNDYNYRFTLSNRQIDLPDINVGYTFTNYAGQPDLVNPTPLSNGSLNSFANQIPSNWIGETDIAPDPHDNFLDNHGTGSNSTKSAFYNELKKNTTWRSKRFDFGTGTFVEYDSSQHHNHLIVHEQAYLYQETLTHEHRIKADKGIKIRFSGGSEQDASITVAGNLILNQPFKNIATNTSITSTAGSIISAADTSVISTKNLVLSAVNGSIGTLDRAINVKLAAGSTVDAQAGNTISIRETVGDLRLKTATTTQRGADFGAIKLRAAGTIIQENPGIAISGSSINLISDQSGLGSDLQAITIDTNGGAFSANAQGDIFAQEISGDLSLDSVQALGGQIDIRALGGQITDSNSVESRDLKTEAELLALWGANLGLTDNAKIILRQAAQRRAVEERGTHAYRVYWQQRGSSNSATFVLDATTRAALIGDDDPDSDAALARIAAFETKYENLYADWNDDIATAEDPAYRYTLTQQEEIDILGDLGWTVDQLTQNISVGVFAQTGSTNALDEEPNVKAFGDITLAAQSGIGASAAPYIISANTPLTSQDVVALSGVLPGDLTIDATGNVTIRQQDDVNFEFTQFVGGASVGVLDATSQTGSIFMASQKGAQIARVTAPDNVVLKLKGDVLDAGTGPSATIQSRNISLESGLGTIGTTSKAVSLATSAGGFLRIASDKSAYVAAQGDVAISSAFAADQLDLDATGAITDFFTTSVVRVAAGSISLSGSMIGDANYALTFEQKDPANGTVNLLARAGGVHVISEQAVRLQSLQSAADTSLQVRGAADLTLIGANTINAGNNSVLDIDTAGRVLNASSTGTDFTAATLNVKGAKDWGSAAIVLTSHVANLSITDASGIITLQPWNAYFANTGDLTLANVNQPGGSLLNLSTNGSLTAQNTAFQNAVLSSTAAMTLNTVTSNGELSAHSDTDLSANTVTSAGAMSLRAAVVTAQALKSATLAVTASQNATLSDITSGVLNVQAGGDLSLQNATVTRAALTSTGAMTLEAVTSTADLAAKAGGNLTAKSVTSRAGMTLSGATVTARTLASADLTLKATQSAKLSDITSLLLSAETGGDLSVQGASIARGDLVSGGTLVLETIVSRAGITAQSSTSMSLRSAKMTRGDFTSGGAMTVKAVTSSTALTAQAGGTLNAEMVTTPDLVLSSNSRLTLQTAKVTNLKMASEGAQSLSGVTVRDRVMLSGPRITAHLMDVTPADGLSISATGVQNSHAAVVGLDIQTTGKIHMFDSRFITGDVKTSGIELKVSQTNIKGAAYFRVKSTDLYAERNFSGLKLDADIQILAVAAGVTGDLDFVLTDVPDLTTTNLLANIRLRSMLVNGVQNSPLDASYIVDFLTPRLMNDEATELSEILRILLSDIGVSQGTSEEDAFITGSAFDDGETGSTAPVIVQ